MLSRPSDPVPPGPSGTARQPGGPIAFRSLGQTVSYDASSRAESIAVRPGHGFPDSALPADRYEITGEIARGGMGAVLRAWDRVLGRELAVKVPTGGDGRRPSCESRFLREARIAGRLQHPGVVTVYDAGRLPDGRPFIAMRLVRGEPLDVLLGGRPDPGHDLGRWLAVVGRVCRTVAYAHSEGVIHRDLKPHNVLVAPGDHAWVLDWGLAKVLCEADAARRVDPDPPAGATDLTRHGTPLGTPGYMAPEQARGEPGVGRPADVFGLGAVLCQVLTGRPPFAHPDRWESWRRNVAGEVGEALARLAGCGADRRLVEVAGRCLAADPDRRPRDAGEVAAALTRTGIDRPCRKCG